MATNSSDKPRGKPRGKPFVKGQTGNPAGRPPGKRNAFTVAFEDITENHGGDLAKKVWHLALVKGDPRALKLAVERQMPPLKDQKIVFDLPEINSVEDLPKATKALLQGVARGELTPSEAGELSKLIEAHIKALEAVVVEGRLAALEANKSTP